ncbi:hypothetical protein FQR65_LT08635 [Abscondita terminalis]|nr:hypothetical protein FQR65_LT08635 [Abscondita terminalis]
MLLTVRGCDVDATDRATSTGISFYDIIKLVQYGELLCSCIYRGKTDKIMKPSHERDFKLINLVLSFEYYTLIVFGTALKKPALFVPWLTLYAFIIMGDVLVFVVHLFNEGCNFDKNFLSSGMLLVYNWLAIFCLFFHIKTGKY